MLTVYNITTQTQNNLCQTIKYFEPEEHRMVIKFKVLGRLHLQLKHDKHQQMDPEKNLLADICLYLSSLSTVIFTGESLVALNNGWESKK